MPRPASSILIVGLALTCGCAKNAPDVFLDAPDFQLTERSGRTVSRDDLKGKVWIASFVFTRCAGPCPLISGNMARLQNDLADLSDVRLVTFSVDPERDTPDVLKEYAARFSADPERWLFLSGDKATVHTLVEKGFRLGVSEAKGTARTPGNEFDHSTKLVLVDRQGRVRGYPDGKFAAPTKGDEARLTDPRAETPDPEKFLDLRRQVQTLLREK